MAGITREELELLLETVVRSAPSGLLKLESELKWRADHEEFCRRLSTRLVEALAIEGFAWARIPQHGDDLYRVLIGATNDVSSLTRTGLVSESAGSRESARYEIAQRILTFLERTQTAVVRRKPDHG